LAKVLLVILHRKIRTLLKDYNLIEVFLDKIMIITATKIGIGKLPTEMSPPIFIHQKKKKILFFRNTTHLLKRKILLKILKINF